MELSHVAGTNARWYNRIGKLENSVKFKLFLKYDSVVLFLNIYPGEMKTSVYMNICIY